MSGEALEAARKTRAKGPFSQPMLYAEIGEACQKAIYAKVAVPKKIRTLA